MKIISGYVGEKSSKKIFALYFCVRKDCLTSLLEFPFLETQKH